MGHQSDFMLSDTGPLAQPLTNKRSIYQWVSAESLGIVWETNAYGRRTWMMPKMHAVYVATLAELAADRDLSVTAIAHLAGVSQGYASKVIRWLDRFGFITILGVFRGRWGRIVAKLRSIIPPPRERSLRTGGMIKRERAPMGPAPTFDDSFYALWDANEAKIRG